MSKMNATGARRAGRSRGRRPVARASTMRRRLNTVEDELRQLVDINLALLHRMVGDGSVADGIFAAEFDTTDAVADKCKTRRAWKGRVQGDFYFVRRLGRSIYFVVGDATGHHALAGGLKLFFLTGLVKIFEEFARDQALPQPTDIMRRLNCWLSTSADTSSDDGRISGGANVIVIRVDVMPRRAVVYASAGLPVHALGAKFVQHGCFCDLSGVPFLEGGLQDNQDCQDTEIDIEGVRFLAIVTDGFRQLSRRPPREEGGPGKAGSVERFSDRRVAEALLQGSRSQGAADSFPARDIARTLTADARQFRCGHYIPENGDDHRLVVIVDLDAIWRDETGGLGNGLGQADPPPCAAEATVGVMELKGIGKTAGRLTKCLP